MWATCKESVVQINPHSNSNEWELASCRHEAVNSPGFWASIISRDCSWTYWGAQIVSATRKATPLRQRGTVQLSSCLSHCNVWIVGPKVQTLGRRQGCKLLWVGCLPSFIYLFIYSFYTLFCQYLRGRCFSSSEPPTTLFFSKGLGVLGKKNQLHVK